jgi:hypothetical protein
MVLVLIVVAAACVFGVVASLIISWASGKSGFWNIGFGVVIALAGAGVLLITVALLMRRFSH